MSKVVDERVVSMQFDNKRFESNVKNTMSTLDKLKQSLNLSGAAKGLEDIEATSNRVNMYGLSNAIETVGAKFSALQVIGITALANITNSAVNAGKRLISSLTIDQVSSGFDKYADKTSAVQTIMAATAKDFDDTGKQMEYVNEQLGKLNWFTDETSYNFLDMVSNIGKFTSNNIKLDKSVTAMQGISTWAAISGANTNEASRAMYNLSQAIAVGSVKLIDWKSIENANMATAEFKQTAIDTAVSMGTLTKKADGTFSTLKGNTVTVSNFNEALSDAWFTSDVLMSTLDKYGGFADDLYEASEKTGLSASQLLTHLTNFKDGTLEISKVASETGLSTSELTEMFTALGDETFTLGQRSFRAAQEAKTFKEAISSVKDAVSTGWMNSFELVFGNYEEAKVLWTDLANAMYDVFASGAEARNDLLQGWKDMGGRTSLIDSFKNAFGAVGSLVEPITEAFKEIFPPITDKQLFNFTEGLKNLTEKMEISETTANNIKRTFKGFFSIFDIGKKIITTIAKAIGELFGSKGISSVGEAFLNATASIGDFFTELNEKFDIDGISGVLSNIASAISNVLNSAVDKIGGFGGIFSSVGKVISTIAKNILEAFKGTFTWISDNVSASDIFAALAGGGVFALGKKFAGLLDKIGGAIENLFGKKESRMSGVKEQFADILGSLHKSLESFSSGIKIASIVGIAVAVGILSASLKSIAQLKSEDIAKSLFAIGTMMSMLSLTLKSMTKSLSKFDSKGIVKSSFSLILVATSIKILSGAMKKLAELSLRQIAKGLIAMGGSLSELAVGLKIIGTTKVPLATSIAMIALAESCSILGTALKKFGGMNWDEIGRGLVAMGGALAELVISLGVLSKIGGGALLGSLGIFVAVQSLSKLSDSLKKFGEMAWDEIGRGLSAMGGALGELGLTLGLLGKFSGFSSVLASTAILIGVQGLKKLADALKKFGEMTWSEIVKGLSGMGGALGEVAVITGVLGKSTGLSGFLGAGAILLGVQGLDDLASALKKFGEMNWDEIGRGLVAMGGALGEIAIISGVLGNFAPIGAMVGSGSLLLAIQGLDDLAGSLKKFSEMSWDEIGRGLSAMGGALGEVALGGLLNTLSAIGTLSIAGVAEPLGTLAESIKKWGTVTIPENLSNQLGELANGIMSFTFSGFGADALATSAPAIGALADSVGKWAGVNIPDGLSNRISSLADGITSFTFSGFGADALAMAAPAVGNLADSIKRWSDVIIPDGLESGLVQIANGIQAFSFAFAGGWSLGTITGPLKTLAESIKKWNDISVPNNLEKGLQQIANGVQAFSFAFAGGWSIGAIAGPLKTLAESIKKWNGISVPDNLKDKLKSLADGVKAFSFAFVGGWSIETIAEPLSSLGISIKNWNGITIPANIGDKLASLAKGITEFTNVKDITAVANNIGIIATAAVNLSNVSFDTINSSLSNLITSITNLSSSGSSLSEIGEKIISSFVSSIINGESEIRVAVNTLMLNTLNLFSIGIFGLSLNVERFTQELMSTFANGILMGQTKLTTNFILIINKAIAATNAKKQLFSTAGLNMVTQFVSGITNGYPKISTALLTMLTKMVIVIRNQYANFYNAGGYLVQGFADGITANTFIAEARARAMAMAALQAAKAELGIASPSKEFYKLGAYSGQGFINALSDYADKTYSAGVSIANSAKKGLSNSINKLLDIVNVGIDSQPTIRPVLDLSNVTAGSAAINTMFDKLNPSIELLSNAGTISSMMNQINQNGKTDDIVLSIERLRKDLGNAKGDTIYIDGITYDDGSNISEAVQTLVRAAKMERRK